MYKKTTLKSRFAFKWQGMRESNSQQWFWRPLLYHLTNPLYVPKTFLLYHNSQKVSRYFIYYICKEFRQVFIR